MNKQVFIIRAILGLILFILAVFLLIQQDNNRRLSIRVQVIQRSTSQLQNANKEIEIQMARINSLEAIEEKAVRLLNMRYPQKVIFLKKGNKQYAK